MNIDLTQFHQGFFEETDEHIATIESLLLSPEARASSRDQLDAIFRAAHSIKGGSGTFGFTEMSHLTHKLESLFDRVRQGQSELSDAVIDAALRALDVVREMLARYRDGRPIEPELDAQSTAELQALIDGSGGSPVPAPAAAAAPPARKTFEVWYRALHEPDEKKREQTYDALLLAVAEAGEMLDCALSDGFKTTLVTGGTETDLRDIFGFLFVEGDELTITELAPAPKSEPYGFFPGTPGAPQAAAPPGAPVPQASAPAAADGRGKPAVKDESIRVSINKVDALINLVGEIVTAENILAGAIRQFDAGATTALIDAADKVARHTRDLRQIVMAIRMVPISFILGRFPRVVRETAAKLGKEVDLRLAGEDTELDKSIIERVVDPLTHLVRNAVDHGFEMPDERVAAGSRARAGSTCALRTSAETSSSRSSTTAAASRERRSSPRPVPWAGRSPTTRPTRTSGT
jgi:two-component system chemotaxis sensor kinase CheA